jgi:hypothetical protein
VVELFHSKVRKRYVISVVIRVAQYDWVTVFQTDDLMGCNIRMHGV